MGLTGKIRQQHKIERGWCLVPTPAEEGLPQCSSIRNILSKDGKYDSWQTLWRFRF